MNIDPKMEEQLRKIGLSDKEVRIYLTLLESGGGYASVIADQAGVNRSTTYAVLTDLAVKGLVNEIEKGKKLYYQLEPPKRLEQFARDGVRLAQRRMDVVKRALPELEGLFASTGYKPRIRFFEGIDGVKRVYDDHVTDHEPYEMVGYSNVGKLLENMSDAYFVEYVKRKQRLGIVSRVILPDSKRGLDEYKTIYSHVSRKIWPESRFIPAEDFLFGGEMTIYGNNRVSIINFERSGQVGVIIEDDTIHNMMRMIFNLSWKAATA